MKYLYKIVCIAVLVVVGSCADLDQPEYVVAKPESVAMQEEIDGYDPLKTYADDGLMLGAGGIDLTTYMSQGVPYRLINSNFNELTLASGMNHADVVQADGSLVTGNVEEFLSLVSDAGLSVFGNSLTWHQNQNAEYLNSTIAPIVIPAQGGPAWEEVFSSDFETGTDGWGGWGNESTRGQSADGEGYNGSGFSYTFTNPSVVDFWGAQVAYDLPAPLDSGSTYRVTFQVRSSTSGAIRAEVQSTSDYSSDGFGVFNVTEEWTEHTLQIVTSASDRNRFVISFGDFAGTVYIDNVMLEVQNENGGGGPAWEVLSANDFETEDASNYEGNTNAVLSFTADGEGANGEGRALKISNSEVRTNDWDAQFFITFEPATIEGERYKLSMDVKADEAVSFPTQAHIVPYDYQHWNFFNAIDATTEWSHIEVEITAQKGQENDETVGVTAIAFNLGATATNYYFDNVEVSWFNEDAGGETIIEKTPEEKRDTLSIELEKWISGVVTASKEQVNAWNVVNEPMDDANPAELRSGEGLEPGDNEFYWQDYLGKDYGVIAFNLAREYAKDGDLLFINESNLESSPEKVQGLIDYVEYIESEGATVDGIGTQMHVSVDSDKDNIAQMFEMLAFTGKMIRVSELNVSIGVDPTAELMQEQADMYEYVINAYQEYVPKNQRYGITIWGVSDVGGDAPTYQGLWNAEYTRKRAYVGVAEGLSSN